MNTGKVENPKGEKFNPAGLREVSNPVDIVYPLGTGSLFNNLELRYSLRSLEKYVHNYQTVYIVGEKPGWINWEKEADESAGKIIHIPYKEFTGSDRAHNVVCKLFTACEMPELTEDFLLMNDDFFFVCTRDAVTYPNYYKGEIKDTITTHRNFHYKRRLQMTYDELKARGFGTRDFGIHLPVIINKTAFPYILGEFEFSAEKTYSFRCLYGNLRILEATYLTDVKIYTALKTPEQIESKASYRDCISINDASLNDAMKIFLQNKFPEPSPYEIPGTE